MNRLSSLVTAIGCLALVTLGLAIASLAATGGHLGYTLDDPYIHLALAERLAAGHYGINLSEPSSPSSSILWPFLIELGVGTPWHPYVPLALNLVFAALTAILIGTIVDRWPWLPTDAWTGLKRATVTIIFIFLGNLSALVFSGMEHSLQVLLTVACTFGMAEALNGQRIPLWCVIATAVGPCVRYEMFALVVALSATLLADRRWRAALGLVVGSLVIPAAFGAYLVSLGLPPLPDSVLFKSNVPMGSDGLRLLGGVLSNAFKEAAHDVRYLFFAQIIATLSYLGWSAKGDRRRIAWAAALALVLHVLFGRMGWFFRYEVYALLFGGLVLFLTLAPPVSPRLRAVCLVLLALYAVPYARATLRVPGAVANIYEQQYQMHRFASDYWGRDFAVNDLGWVSYKIDPHIYVLDLMGLASPEALRERHKNAEWLDAITQRHHIGLVMIYPGNFESIPDRWTAVGTMHLRGSLVTAWRSDVVFFATRPDGVPEIRAKLRAFAPTLPPGASMEMG